MGLELISENSGPTNFLEFFLVVLDVYTRQKNTVGVPNKMFEKMEVFHFRIRHLDPYFDREYGWRVSTKTTLNVSEFPDFRLK